MKLFAILAALSLTCTAVSPALASGDIEPKDTLQQNPGPGNLDVPTKADKITKPTPTPVPVPTPLPKPKKPGT